MMEDMMKYGSMMGMPGGMMQGMQGMMQGMQGAPTLQKPHLRHRRSRKPSRLLRKTRRAHPKMKLRKPREFFPFWAFNNQQGQTGGINPMMFGYDGMDSEDRAAYLMMGGNANNMPPPIDGIDGEDLWMYRGTKYDPMRYFQNAQSTTSTSTDADTTTTGSTTTATKSFNPYFLPWMWSSLQK